MSYMTQYRLEWDDEAITMEQIIKALAESDSKENEPGQDNSRYWYIVLEERQEVTWYFWEEDMLALSLKFADVLFTLYGEGEQRDDVWCAYFKDGKVQRARTEVVVTHEPFDEAKLVTPVSRR